MLSDLTACLTDLYTDPHGSREVTYTPVAGSAVVVRALKSRQQPTFTQLGADTAREATWFEVQRSEVPIEPTEGATITEGAEVFRVRTVTVNWSGTAWRCFVQPGDGTVAGSGPYAQLPLLVGQWW